MKLDLQNLSAVELQTIIENANQLLVEQDEKRINEAKEKIMQIAQENGLSVYFGSQDQTHKVSPKYKDEKGNTWAGRGKMPNWLSNAIAGGAKVEDFLINK